MDVDTTVFTEEIIQIIDRHPGLVANRFDNLRKIRRMIEHGFALRPLKEVLSFLDKKSLLNQNLFDFIIENKRNLNQLGIFLKWLKEFSASSGEILDFFKRFDDINDIDRVITRLDELEFKNVFDTEFDFTFFSVLISLIDEGIDQEKYINLIRDVENKPNLLKALRILKKNDLLQDPYYEFVFDKENFFPVIKAELISKLKNNDALNEQNFNICKKETNLILRTELINILESNDISLRDNFLTLAAKNIHSLLGVVKYLEKKSLLTEEQITKLKSVSDNSLKYLINIILLVDELESPDEISLFIVEKSERLRKLLRSVMVLKNENYLTVENYRLLSTNLHYPDVVFQFAQALVVLRNNQLDDLLWKNEAYNSENPLQLVFFLKELNKASLLSDTNLAQIKRINVPPYFLRILKALNRLHGLTEDTFAKLVKLDRVLVSAYPLYEKLSRMKSISLELLSDIFLISSEDLDKPTKLEKIEQLLELEGKASLNKPRLSINREQSTHVSSVQFSISQSVKRFLQKYGEHITPSNLEKNFLEITDELKFLVSDDNVKNRAARSALEKIISSSDYIEPISKLSLRELLVLLWEGIQDDSLRISSLLDAKIQIIEGLYEIQRGGNIDAFGQDNGLPDEAICCTGAFNKLVEKLAGIHQFVEIINITPELAATKFPLVVREKATDYLISLEHEQLLLTYDLLKEEGIAFIWKHIAANVQKAMLAEFSPLYQLESGEVTEDFKRLIASHEDLEIDERLLASIKSSYALRKLDLATSVNAFSDCAEVSNVNQRLKRSVSHCIKKNTVKEKRYRPFTALHRDFEYALSFFMGRVESDLQEIVVEKIEILQKMAKDRYLSINILDDFAVANLEGVCEIWLMAERFIKESTDIALSNLIEFSFGKKKYYITIKRNSHSVGSYRVYCPTFNKEAFFDINSDVDIEEAVEIFKEVLYADLPLYQIKTRYLSYFQPENYLSIFDFQAIFFISVQTSNIELHEFEGVPRKGFYDFFLINGEFPTETDINFLFNHGLNSEYARLSFALEKTPEAISYFSEQEQIALGKLLFKYSIPVEETKSVLIGSELNKFHKELLQLLIDYANKNEVISEEKLSELVRETSYLVLIKTDLDSEELNSLLEDLVQSHNEVKFKLENLVGLSRLSILLAPTLINALNGHSDNLIHLASMMGGDYVINESYLNLIKHERFIRHFPKLSTLLQKGQYALASPICKLLLLSSFYTLIKQLVNTPTNSPEYKMAQSLLVDNTVLFSVLFAEAFGLELGPAGIILDLGITIHQLLIASDYIRQHYHLQVSLWEGIKFELGFDGIVKETLESREMVRLNLVGINNLSKNSSYYFSHVILKAPKIVEIEAKEVERKEVPNFFLKKIALSPLKQITSLSYIYKAETRMGRLQSYHAVSYLKRQILVESPKEIIINFSEKNISFVQENNIFVKFEEQCKFGDMHQIKFDIKCASSIYRSVNGIFFCLRKDCFRNPVLTEGWSVASSTTLSDKRTGRIENVHSVILDGDVGAMLKNEHAFNLEEIWIKVLVLFNPHFGNMTLKDGSFLTNQTLVVLIQDPPLADIIVNDRMISMSFFNFTGVCCLNKLHYWVGFNTLSSVIRDNLDYLSIYLMPLSLNDPEQTITMLYTSQLRIGEKGPKFIFIEQKQEITIYFKPGYVLYGYFNFVSPVIKLYNATVESGAVAVFILETHQICSLENIQGTYAFYSHGKSIAVYETIIHVTRLGANVNLHNQLNNTYVIESNQLLNFLIVNYDGLYWFPYNFTELNVFWCQIDCPLIHVKSKVSDFLNLTFKGRFKLVDKNYTAWFSFKAENMVCNFFNLEVSDLLLANFASFKSLLDKGCISFIFSKSGYLADELKYIASENEIVYQEIQYRLDEDYQLVAVSGELVTSHIERFDNLLPNIAIDLRDKDLPIRIANNKLQVADRIFTGISTTALLLTKLGRQYMGLLPIFTPSEARAANLQVNIQEINESGYFPGLNRHSKDTSDSQLTNLSKGFIVFGSLFTFSILTKCIISYRHRVNNLPGMIEMGLVNAVAASLLPAAVQATYRNTLAFSTATNVASYYQYTQKNAKQPDMKQKATEQNSTNYKGVVPIFFQQLPQQVLFLNWCIGFYKKLMCPKTISSENKFEELFIILAKKLVYLSHSQYITAQQKKVLYALLTSIHRLIFLIKPNMTCFLITKKTDFIIWNDFIHNLFVFEKYFKQHRMSRIVWVLKRLDTISIELNHDLLNCIDYPAAIERLRKLLVSAANMPDVKRCYALNLLEPQWVISRLNVLQDALIDLKNSRKLVFSEFKYYLSEVLPEAKRLSSGLANKYFTLNSLSYLNLVAAMDGDCSDDNLFQGSNSSKSVNVLPATHYHLLKASFFALNKRVANSVEVDYAENDGNSVDFSARHSNLRNTSHSLG